MMVQYLFIAAQAAALARLLVIRYPYRLFLVALALWTAQAVNVALAVPTAEWTRTWWRYPEIAVVLASAAAVVESIERERRYVTSYRGHLLRMASIAIPLCVVLVGGYFVSPLAGDTQDKFNQIRAWIWAYLALSMIVVQLLMVMESNATREPYVVAHSILLMVVMIAHAVVAPLVVSPDSVWYTARNWRLVVTLCCFMWIACFRGRGGGLRFGFGER